MMAISRCTTHSSEETVALGARLGGLLQPGDVVALFGDLGAGKTTFTRGVAAGMGLSADVSSPTFTLIHEHPGPIPLYHIDLYRLGGEDEVEALGIEEYLYGGGVTLIEWAERMLSLLPASTLRVTLRSVGETDRELIFEAAYSAGGLIERLGAQCS